MAASHGLLKFQMWTSLNPSKFDVLKFFAPKNQFVPSHVVRVVLKLEKSITEVLKTRRLKLLGHDLQMRENENPNVTLEKTTSRLSHYEAQSL